MSDSVASPTDTILAMCRSGGRSAQAVNRLAEAGFTHVYNIIDGMVYHSYRMKNGWKNSGLPWTCAIAPDRLVLPKVR